MAYAAIMVGVGQDAASDARVALAHRLASRFEASLIGVAAEAAVANAMLDGDTATLGGSAEHETRRLRARLADAERRFRAALPLAANTKVEWRSFIDHPGDVLARESRSADLMVVGAGGTIDAGDVLMAAGRPVLVVPAGIDRLHCRQVVIGWGDTAQSRRAVSDALPLLRRAEGALVLAVTEQPDTEADAAEAAVFDVIAFLARHGVSADGEVRPLRCDTVAKELVQAARDRGADLIVTGAYGHARDLEWSLGGVTRALLTRCPICCLMSH
jgi:nucleotide-binding universal stress UspA family protein